MRRRARAAVPVRPLPPAAGTIVSSPAPRNLVQARTSDRVLFVGEVNEAFASCVHGLVDGGGPLRMTDELGPQTLDAALIGAGVPRSRYLELAEQAHDAGVPLIMTDRKPVIEVRDVNPRGWQRSPGPHIGVLLAHPDRSRTWRAVDQAEQAVGRERLVLLIAEPWRNVDTRGLNSRSLPAGPRERGRELQTLRGVIDLPGMHWSAPDRAQWIVEVAARGVPVVAEGLDELQGRLAEPLALAVAATTLVELEDDRHRELTSMAQRRRALRHHGAWQLWSELASRAGLAAPRAPRVSVLLATNRPDHVLDAVGRIDRQTHPEVEIVVALHGDGFAAGTSDAIRRTTTRPVQVLRESADRPLGAVLNAATEAASGDLIAKMDDDDLYDADHLTDLIESLRYSGATLVGKGSEFVYLEELDTTIRRFPHGSESSNRNVAGGTLMIARDDLIRAGWWQRAPRTVDQRLVDDVKRAGGSLHRTHGHGFVLYRRHAGHTWESTADYFLQQAVHQWRGLALAAAGVG
jgi:hypothetical protein